MTIDAAPPIEERIVQLLRHLGIRAAHFAACMSRDWGGLVAKHSGAVSSLTLVCPMGANPAALRAGAPPLLVVAGDRGRPAEEARQAAESVPQSTFVTLSDYFSPPWADAAADRTEQVGAAMIEFLSRVEQRRAAKAAGLPQGRGEIAEISYRVVGSGPPLILLPLALAPSQWEPLLPALSARYTVIVAGGAALGMVAHLEARGRSGYLGAVRNLLSEAELRPAESLLEVGCGPGVILRWLARRTDSANRIVGVDVNRYLLREGAALAEKDGVAGAIELVEGNAESLPFADDRFDVTMACTLLEEGAADRMLAEFVRVTRPGGRVAVLVRSVDMPWWVNLSLRPELKTKVETGRVGGNVQENGCADASLYRRLRDAGLVRVTICPQLATYAEGERLEYIQERIVAALDSEEAAEWQEASARAQSERTFFIAEPFHAAVGTKPTP